MGRFRLRVMSQAITFSRGFMSSGLRKLCSIREKTIENSLVVTSRPDFRFGHVLLCLLHKLSGEVFRCVYCLLRD